MGEHMVIMTKFDSRLILFNTVNCYKWEFYFDLYKSLSTFKTIKLSTNYSKFHKFY